MIWTGGAAPRLSGGLRAWSAVMDNYFSLMVTKPAPLEPVYCAGRFISISWLHRWWPVWEEDKSLHNKRVSIWGKHKQFFTEPRYSLGEILWPPRVCACFSLLLGCNTTNSKRCKDRKKAITGMIVWCFKKFVVITITTSLLLRTISRAVRLISNTEMALRRNWPFV